MTFEQLRSKFEKNFGVNKLADIARELDVSPQVVSNWKARDQVPYKYVKILRKKINKSKKDVIYSGVFNQSIDRPIPVQQEYESTFPIAKYIGSVLEKFYSNILLISIFVIFCLLLSIIFVKYYDDPIFVSSATLVPTTSSTLGQSAGGLQGFAKQFGINTGSAQIDNSLTSSIFVPDIVNSRYLAKKLLNKKFETEKYGQKLSLISIVNGVNRERADWSLVEKIIAVKRIRKMISLKVSRDSPLHRLRIKTFEPLLAKNIADTLIISLGKVMEDFKNSSLREKKKFIQTRINEVSKDLEASENKLKEFRERNRKIISSPNLMLKQERLLRDLEVKTQIYITVKSELEMVQIEEIGRSKMIQVLDTPEVPLKRSDPRPIEIMLATLLFSLIIGMGLIFLMDWYSKNRNDILKFIK